MRFPFDVAVDALRRHAATRDGERVARAFVGFLVDVNGHGAVAPPSTGGSRAERPIPVPGAPEGCGDGGTGVVCENHAVDVAKVGAVAVAGAGRLAVRHHGDRDRLASSARHHAGRAHDVLVALLGPVIGLIWSGVAPRMSIAAVLRGRGRR